MKRFHRSSLLFVCWILTSAVSGRGEDFYQVRLGAGKDAYRQKRAQEAVDQLRIAAFGFLDRPALLLESLARLALAQAAAGRSADVEDTLSRLVEVERRFAPYAEVRLEPDVRAEFHALLLQRVPRATLLSLAGFGVLVDTDDQKIAKLPPAERRRALEAAFRREPGKVAWSLGLAREAAQREAHKDVVKWTGKALEVDGGNTEALALRVHARAARRECAEALGDLKALPQAELDARPELHADRFVCLVESKDWAGAEGTLKLIPAQLKARNDVARAEQNLAAERQRRNKQNAGKAGGDAKPSAESHPNPPQTIAPDSSANDQIAPAQDPAASGGVPEVLAESRRLVQAGKAREAEKILVEALRSEPGSRKLRLALLEAFCLSRDWQKGATQLSLVSPFLEEEAVPMFYAAVVLYETGRIEEARGYMERAVPRLSGPFVDEYARKILGRL